MRNRLFEVKVRACVWISTSAAPVKRKPPSAGGATEIITGKPAGNESRSVEGRRATTSARLTTLALTPRLVALRFCGFSNARMSSVEAMPGRSTTAVAVLPEVVTVTPAQAGVATHAQRQA